MNPLTLHCPKCGKETRLDLEGQNSILARLVRPADVHLLDCNHCGLWQWVLGARDPRNERQAP